MKYKLDNICKIGSSKRIYLSEYKKSGIPFYRGKEIIEKSNNQQTSSELYISKERYLEIKDKFEVPHKGDILLSAVGTLGKSWFVDEEEFYFKDGNLIWLSNFNNKIVNNKYLFYKLNSKWFKNLIESISIGSTQKAITIDSLKKTDILLPDLDKQNKIVKILNIMNDKIKNNIETNNNLLLIA